jgi:hypothetical protein
MLILAANLSIVVKETRFRFSRCGFRDASDMMCLSHPRARLVQLDPAHDPWQPEVLSSQLRRANFVVASFIVNK